MLVSFGNAHRHELKESSGHHELYGDALPHKLSGDYPSYDLRGDEFLPQPANSEIVGDTPEVHGKYIPITLSPVIC